MAITLTVAWALLVLAPGFGVFAGAFMARGRDVVHPAPPAPTSVLSIGVVVFGAMLLHAVAAAVLLLVDFLGDLTQWTVPFDPNVYRYFIAAGAARYLGTEVALLLLILVFLSGAGFLTTRAIVQRSSPGTTLHSFLYGWLGDILEQLGRKEPGYRSHLFAWVLTDVELGAARLGYQGQVEAIALTSDKQISWITLQNCEVFALAAGTDGTPQRRSKTGSLPIPRIQIEGPRIANFAYVVVRVSRSLVDAETVDSPTA